MAGPPGKVESKKSWKNDFFFIKKLCVLYTTAQTAQFGGFCNFDTFRLRSRGLLPGMVSIRLLTEELQDRVLPESQYFKAFPPVLFPMDNCCFGDRLHFHTGANISTKK